MVTTLLESYSIALESVSDLNHRVLKENRELRAENDKLRAENVEGIADLRVIEGLEDKVRELKADLSCKDDCIMDLRADRKRLYKEHIECRNALEEQVSDLMIDKDKLKEANKHKEYSHFPKEYNKEADEYFEYNEKCTKVLFFMIDSNEFEWDEDNGGMNGMNGEFSGTLYADDCIAEVDNI